MKKLLVFDFGASSGRAIMFTKSEEGGSELVAEEIHRFKNTPIIVFGTLCWDIDKLFGEVKKILPKAIEMGAEAIAVDTWGVDFALINAKGEYVEKPTHYRDKRTDNIYDEVCRIVSEEEMYSRTGIKALKINTNFQLYALNKSAPEQLSKAAKLLMMPDLFAFLLTGACKNEYTIATTTGLVDCHTRNWDYELIEKFGFPKNIFGEIIFPGDIYGYVSEELTGNIGGKKIPVIASAGHDTASAVASIDLLDNTLQEEKQCFISCGTWTLFGTLLDTPITTAAARLSGMTNEGGAWGKITFLKNIMGMWLAQETKRYYAEMGTPYSFDELEQAAREVEPHFAIIDPNAPEFEKPCKMPEVIAGYCEKNGLNVPHTAGEVMRVIYDSLAATFAQTLTDIEKLTGEKYATINIFGGGAKDKTFCEAVAAATQRKVIAGAAEATALGNAKICFASQN